MFLSVFDLYKIGIGPSSSHTMGPMVAAARFLAELKSGSFPLPSGAHVARLRASLHGSLAFTGVGHATDRAVALGLAGHLPDTIDADAMDALMTEIIETRTVKPAGHPVYAFDFKDDIVFDKSNPLPGHANGMTVWAEDADGTMLLSRVYYSIGGGFVVSEEELNTHDVLAAAVPPVDDVPYGFSSAAEMLAMAKASGKSIAQMKRANEEARMGVHALNDKLDGVWKAMDDCIERGLRTDGILPGGLRVQRRAAKLWQHYQQTESSNQFNPLKANDALTLYAMAVNEENAAGAKVVTAPTNGAAGTVPAVLKFATQFVEGVGREQIRDFLLTSAAVGGIIKHNASISGAEVGCQGEVGSAAAMAAAGLAQIMGGTPEQVENAAEIALEHHLGMTCDPIAGLVQVPCIERNGIAAVKAVTAASLAVKGNGEHI
ncbi:MAG: L-serine ammonia-lyase, partial [Ahrensia sp.]